MPITIIYILYSLTLIRILLTINYLFWNQNKKNWTWISEKARADEVENVAKKKNNPNWSESETDDDWRRCNMLRQRWSSSFVVVGVVVTARGLKMNWKFSANVLDVLELEKIRLAFNVMRIKLLRYSIFSAYNILKTEIIKTK